MATPADQQEPDHPNDPNRHRLTSSLMGEPQHGQRQSQTDQHHRGTLIQTQDQGHPLPSPYQSPAAALYHPTVGYTRD
jgi:hypothetical protein